MSKKGIEQGWSTTANYRYDDPKLLAHMADSRNYGVLTGVGNLCVVDGDTKPVREAVEKGLPQTYTVQSGREGGGMHYYFWVEGPLKTHKLHDPEDQDPESDSGHISYEGRQVVGPSSIHPSSKMYMVVNDIEIATVKGFQIEEALSYWLEYKRDDTVNETSDNVKKEETEQAKETKVNWDTIQITDLVNTLKMKQTKNGYQGPHPAHGSTGGSNFSINKTSNQWYCFRCQSGGGPASLIAVLNGVIPCSQARPGGLIGELYRKTEQIAVDKYHLKVPKRRGRPGSPKKEDPYEFPHVMAEEIMIKSKFKTAKDNEELYMYNDGIYHDDGEVRVKARVVEMDSEKSSHYANEVIFQIKAKTYTPREQFNLNTNLIPVLNGLFDLDTSMLLPFNDELIFTMEIPVKYDAAADCPKFKKFMSEVLNAVDIPVIQEVFGYCLVRDYKYQKSLMFVGDGANGKSTLLETLRRFLGRENVSSMPLQDLTNDRFSSSHLYGRLANIFADLPDRALQQTGKFKTLTGGDTVNAQKKFQDGFSFMNYAKLIFSCNKLPKAEGDDSSAFYRRWIILNFPNTFMGDNEVKGLVDQLSTPEELSGIFNWSIEGLKRLRAQGSFSHSKSVDDVRELYDRLSDPLKAFVLDCVEEFTDGIISKETFYAHYVQYCHDHNLPTITKTAIGHELQGVIPSVRSLDKADIEGKRQRAWKGITFRGDAPAVQDRNRTLDELKPHDEGAPDDGGEKTYFD